MRTLVKLAVIGVISALALTAAPTPAMAGSNQSCSSRGKQNSTTCIVNVGDVTVTVIGSRALSNNEISVLEDVIEVNLNRSANDIIDAVVVALVGFDNYSFSSACATKGKGKGSSKSCR